MKTKLHTSKGAKIAQASLQKGYILMKRYEKAVILTGKFIIIILANKIYAYISKHSVDNID